ncbi:hypothetical protein CPB84DRAFT_1646961, partial [Gymnopilus junonius]
EAKKRTNKERKEHQRMMERECQCKHRAKVCAEKVDSSNDNGKDTKKMLMDGGAATAIASGTSLPDLEAVSRTGHDKWKKLQNGKVGGAVQQRASCTNWFHPLLWIHIDKAMRLHDWSTAATEKALKCDHPGLFKKINKGTISKWKE